MVPPPVPASVTEYVTICDMPTQVMKRGNVLPKDGLLFLVIPGNPGIIEYYDEFMLRLHELSGQPVWGVSHAGHITIPTIKDDLFILRKSYEVCSLAGQIHHKIEFVRTCVPPETRLILIGHSVGCYIILHMLDELSSHNILHSYLLFPMIEHMADTNKGQIATPMLRYLHWLGLLVVYGLGYLPPHLQYRLILWYFKGRIVPECIYNASLNLFDTFNVSNIMYMATQELSTICEPDLHIIKRNLHHLSFYYGRDDDWCPRKFCLQMQRTFPEADIRMCTEGYDHAFVLDCSIEMAKLLWDWVKQGRVLAT